MNILIIEDDEIIRNELSTYLKKNGYEVDTITDFENVLSKINYNITKLILLDINFPYLDGYHLCREIRKISNIPIIIVTSRNNDIDELMSINLGADDFITKPYNMAILLARIESVLKRTYTNQSSENLSYNGLTLDTAKGLIIYNDKTENLTKNELKILFYFIKNRGKIIRREELMEYLWSTELFVDDNTLSVNVTRVRKKIESVGMKNPIETRRGLGYILI